MPRYLGFIQQTSQDDNRSGGNREACPLTLLAKYKFINPGSQALPVEPTWRLCLHSRSESPLEAEPPIEQSQALPGIEDATLAIL